ncbi:MAG: N-acetylmuramoyl-L-alanine amidase [bacterium]|nr:N-acetylmuramoyl-L-alanine amidase [bacterium]
MYKRPALLVLLALVAFLAVAKPHLSLYEDTRNFLAATFFVPSITMSDLKHKYLEAERTGEKIRIVLVPGHEPHFGGAEFGKLKERDMNVDLAQELKDKLESDKRFEIIMTRDKDNWNPKLEKYFDANWEAIKDFTKVKKTEMNLLVAEGKVKKVLSGIEHNTAPGDVAYRLFGINRWSRDIGADVLIHIHFNDYPRSRAYLPGRHKGFAIYIPDKQYSNSVATKEIATNIFERLENFFVISDLPEEDIGIIESQDLIAVGQSNSLDAASILIEYGYIYRPQFTRQVSRASLIEQMAEQTYLGLEDSFK